MSYDEREFFELLGALCSGTIDTQQHARLQQLLLANNNSARKIYLDYLHVHLKLREKAKSRYFEDPAPVQADAPGDTTEALTDSHVLDDAAVKAFYQLSKDKKGAQSAFPAPGEKGYAQWIVLAASLAFVLLGIAFWGQNGSRDEVVLASKNSDPVVFADEGIASGANAFAQDANPFIAQIVTMTENVTWANPAGSREFLLRLRAGDPLVLESGLVQVDFFSGASLILSGPCHFVPTGESSGQLLSGELAGRTTIGDFTLTTPSAKIVDLGTEFGISIDNSGSTDVRVFDGKVELATGDSQDSSPKSLLLTEGMTARAMKAGRIDTNFPISEQRFVRSIPLPLADVESLSLVDIMNDYGQGSHRLASGIAPDTGAVYVQQRLASREAQPLEGRDVYQRTDWHPMVDGVFIPSEDGMEVRINSQGDTVNLVPTEARTSGPIWSRRRTLSDLAQLVFHENFWGGGTLERVLLRLQTCEAGIIGVHANAGITFDLDAIRQNYRVTPLVFQTVIANLDSSDQWQGNNKRKKRCVTDIRFFIDGELRRSRYKFGRTDGDMAIDIPLRETDRFLTILATDAGDYRFDQVALIDPTFQLQPTD